MRVSNEAIFNTFIKYDKARQKEIARHTEEISSGKRILSPSDDFAALAKSLKFRGINKEIDNYLHNIDTVKTRQIAAETAMTNIADAGTEVRSEIVRLLNYGVLDMEDAEIVNQYLQELKDYMIDQANTRVGDTYLFGGTKSATPPFRWDSTSNSLQYDGNEEEQKVPVAKHFEARATFNGKGRLGLQEMTDVIEQIRKAIEEDQDLSQITDALLEQFDRGYNKLLQNRSFIGTEERTIEEFQRQHEMYKTVYNNFISELEDADIAAAIAGLERSKVAYEASMAVFNQNKDLSLLKYIAA
ncbi:MAG: flagellar hook protein [Nitratiruptor sp.]|nr:flagellar hook protein [Nitratiruptor sp.]NPA84292.1 flagellar hook protein [Campylobacterota bacterium]